MAMNLRSGRRHHILAIDDDPMMLSLYRDALEDDGYQVSVLAYSEKTVAAVAALAPDLLILDYLWSDPVGGWDFLQQVRTESTTAAVPVLLCTTAAHAMAAIGDPLTVMGIDVVVKPFNLDDFLAAVVRAILNNTVPLPMLASQVHLDQVYRG